MMQRVYPCIHVFVKEKEREITRWKRVATFVASVLSPSPLTDTHRPFPSSRPRLFPCRCFRVDDGGRTDAVFMGFRSTPRLGCGARCRVQTWQTPGEVFVAICSSVWTFANLLFFVRGNFAVYVLPPSSKQTLDLSVPKPPCRHCPSSLR